MIKILLLISYVCENVFDFILVKLNDTYVKKPLPENVRDVYDEEKYNKWINYRNDTKKFSAIQTLVSAFITLILLIFNLHSKIFYLFNFNTVVNYILFILVFTLCSTIISIPFGYYQNFVIEEKYGFNKTTIKTFILDIIKSLVLGLIVSTFLFLVVMFLFEKFGNLGILFTIIAVILFSLAINLLSMPLMRIFNKFTPLEEGELRDSLVNLCEKYNVKIKAIYVMDASRRTTRANAFCTGLVKKTVSLDDNLVNNYTVDEIVAVFAHEFGHAKYKHVLRSIWFSFLRIIILIVALGLILNIPKFCTEFGFDEVNYYFAFTVLTMISWPVSRLFDLVSNKISRTFEYQADGFAAKEGYGEALISALKRLSKDALTNLNPHPVVVKLEYSHPTLSERITAIRKISKTDGTQPNSEINNQTIDNEINIDSKEDNTQKEE
ncbi:MAG: M48 family metallopeptidase [Lachnospiraceae bacterium]|nr:M48 family metallopeptidase [Lachnospiraceae bacterium]